MDPFALLIGFVIGVVAMTIVYSVFVKSSSRKETADLQARLARAEAEAARSTLAAAGPGIDGETRTTLMAELGEKTLELADLRKRTADYAALKSELIELRPKVEALALAEAELDLARAHAQKLREELARVSGEAASLGAENARLASDLASHRERIAAVGRTTSVLVAHLQGAPGTEPAEKVEEPRPVDPAQVGPLPLAPVAAVSVPAGTDPLGQIPGVGPVFERRLWDAGILTFADLAATTPEQVLAVIRPEHWQQIEPEPWIAEARARAGS
ncbi:MAG: hypothetical protein KF857_08900 [Fimbriimonadaceae bacterium]|nr:hypothetical protein [Fimbriimonadaceae bacterium]